jgi:NOL1/NOP2/sun family putative RNA methylase
MSGRQFYTDRYTQLGWKYHDVKLRQSIRINKSNVKTKNLTERLVTAGVKVERIPFLPAGYWVTEAKVSPGATAEYLLGMYSLQEAAAQIPGTLFSALGGKAVLDACAAPGGKTLVLADQMEGSGTITALDVNKQRLSALANHLERCLVSNAVVYNLDARQTAKLGRKFDRILLDVPCSGNFASDREWFLRRTLEDIEQNAKLQREILSGTLKCLAPSGEIVYSTCSLEPEEDEQNIDWAIKNLGLAVQPLELSVGVPGLTEVFGRHLDPQIVGCRRFWPSDTQGFFVCKLRRAKE